MSSIFTPTKTDAPAPSSMTPRASQVTHIARGVKVEGQFSGQGDVVVEGEVHGSFQASGTLTVGTEARIKADVMAQEASVAGHVQGNLNVQKRLELKSTAHVVGDIHAETISIEAGASLDGKILIGKKLVQDKPNAKA